MNPSFQEALQAIVARRNTRPFEQYIQGLELDQTSIDQSLADWWLAADGISKAMLVRVCPESIRLGRAWMKALQADLDSWSSELKLTHDKTLYLNAALQALRQASNIADGHALWRLLAQIAATERSKAVPELIAAHVLADKGPDDAGPTVALTAFRRGPEDAQDRLLSLAQLGRFETLTQGRRWLMAVLKSGAATVEAIAGLTRCAQRDLDAGRDEDLEEFSGSLQSLLGVDGDFRFVDALAMWQCLDALSRLLGVESLPWLQGAMALGPPQGAPWFQAQVGARIAALGGHHSSKSEMLTPLPTLSEQIGSRCPRVSRAAVVRAGDDPQYAKALADRAAVEAQLVSRGQLMASFHVTSEVHEIELGAEFEPWAEALPLSHRARLEEQEALWLG